MDAIFRGAANTSVMNLALLEQENNKLKLALWLHFSSVEGLSNNNNKCKAISKVRDDGFHLSQVPVSGHSHFSKKLRQEEYRFFSQQPLCACVCRCP